MGNTSNPEQWAVQERLRFIERAAYWRGWVQRSDLTEVFGKGSAQVSADFQKYLELNSGALVYSTSRKRYEGQEAMRQVLAESRLEDAAALFMGAGRAPVTGEAEPSHSASVDWVVLPARRAAVEVERRIFQAVLHRRKLRLRYLSVHGRSDEWRWLRPHALAHSGHRWHVRAWCEKNGDYRDFTLGRIVEAGWPVVCEPAPRPDAAWETFVTLTVRPAAALSEEQRAAVAQEFGMTGGSLTLRVREAMRQYVERQLGLDPNDGVPVRLERVQNE
jgi:hypothetical protein